MLCAILEFNSVAVLIHVAAFPDYRMPVLDAIHHMAAFAYIRQALCAHGDCTDITSDFGQLLDIGCHLAGTSLAAAANGFDSVCVERLPRNARRIAASIKLNSHLPGRIRLYASA